MKPRIISIVDDDRIYQFTTQKAIERSEDITGIKKILVFSDGEEAWEYLNKNFNNSVELPDIIFLDLNMPYMDGWEFLSEFALIKAKLAKKIIIYVVSSSVSDTDINRAKQISDVTDYIIKPITSGKFIELIDRLKDL